MDDYYALLQVSPTAERRAIEAAYRRLSTEAGEDQERRAKLDEAYATLTDPALRHRYDRDRMQARAAARRPSISHHKETGGLSGRRLAFTAIGAVAGIAALGAVLLFALNGGDDDNGDPAVANPTATAAFDEFGPPPVLGDSVLDVSPEHGSRIPQEETISPDERAPDNGACVHASFTAEEGITSQWFHIFFNGELVTQRTTWILAQDPDVAQPEGGVLCYAPAEGFDLGIHEVHVQIGPPEGSPRQVVRWAFEVIE